MSLDFHQGVSITASPTVVSSLRAAFDTPESKRRYVRRLFATIAHRYDLITRVLSFGRDRHWKAALADLACQQRVGAVGTSIKALDLACGTGDIAFALASRGASVVGLDVVVQMIELASGRRLPVGSGPSPTFVVGDMMRLPVPGATFDVVTTGYGLRNVPVLDVALEEAWRVLRPGGRLLALDFDRPANVVMRRVFLAYLAVVGSVLGLLLHGDPDTYRYIAASLQRYPGARGVANRMRAIGFTSVGQVPLLGGLMAITYGTR